MDNSCKTQNLCRLKWKITRHCKWKLHEKHFTTVYWTLFTTAWPLLLLESSPSQKVYNITKHNFSKESNQLYFYTFSELYFSDIWPQKKNCVAWSLRKLIKRGCTIFRVEINYYVSWDKYFYCVHLWQWNICNNRQCYCTVHRYTTLISVTLFHFCNPWERSINPQSSMKVSCYCGTGYQAYPAS